nr:M20/M25/M40 family metallo-hydrolase [uncultured Blautia sp.]
MDWQKENLKLLEKMVGISSISGSEKELALFLKEYLKENGIESEIEILKGDSCNLTAKCSFGTRKHKIILGGHLDTVSPAAGWKTDPFQLTYEKDKVYGLGSCDMKGGLAAQIIVLRQMKEEGTAFNGTVYLTAVADEEAFSTGMNHLAEKMPEAELAILAEPHFDNVVTGATGKGLLTFKVHGKPGHAARPETGINAVNSMAKLLNVVEEYYGNLYREGKCGAAGVLRIFSDYAGYSLNIPDCCSALVNKQLLQNETIEEFQDNVEKMFCANKIPGSLEIIREALWYPSYSLDENSGMVKLFLDYLKSTGHKFYTKHNESVSDGNIMVEKCGIPTLLFGPEGDNLHSADEYLIQGSLEKYRRYLKGFIDTLK